MHQRKNESFFYEEQIGKQINVGVYRPSILSL